MGQAKQSRRAHLAVLQRMPYCIYCGGVEPAVTIDHMPPRICFRWKHRPQGLEFPSCKICNEGASHADYVAGLVSRFYETDGGVGYPDELFNMYRSLPSNVPGLLEELKKPRGSEKIALNRLPANMRNGGLLNVSGPILSSHMEVFCPKLGLALHFDATKKVLTNAGGIATRWFTNFELFTGDFPEDIKNIFQMPQTLVQGRKEVSDQFQYASVRGDSDNLCAYFASFRLSFSVVAFVAQDRRLLENKEKSFSVISPADLKQKIVNLAKR